MVARAPEIAAAEPTQAGAPTLKQDDRHQGDRDDYQDDVEIECHSCLLLRPDRADYIRADLG